jgi:hypothetical protein
MKIALLYAVLSACCLAAGLSGCAGVSADVQASPTAAQFQGERSYVVARSPLQDGRSDYPEYDTLVRRELGKYGFADAAGQRAHYLLSIAYDTRPAAIGVATETCTEQGQGCSSPGGQSFSLFGRRSYKHSLTLRFFEQANGREVYKVSASSQDHDADPLHAIPYLVKSTLAQLPFTGHADWRVKLSPGNTGGVPQVVSVKPVQP